MTEEEVARLNAITEGDGINRIAETLGRLDPGQLARRGIPGIFGAAVGSMGGTALGSALGLASPVPGGALLGGIAGAQAGRALDSWWQGEPITSQLGPGALAADTVGNLIPGVGGAMTFAGRAMSREAGRLIGPALGVTTGATMGGIANALDGGDPTDPIALIAGGFGGITGRMARISPWAEGRVILPGGRNPLGGSFDELTEGMQTVRPAAQRANPFPGMPEPQAPDPPLRPTQERTLAVIQAQKGEGVPEMLARPEPEGAIVKAPSESTGPGQPVPGEHGPRANFGEPPPERQAGFGFDDGARNDLPDIPGARSITEPGTKQNWFRMPAQALRGGEPVEARFVGRAIEDVPQAASRYETTYVSRLANVLRDFGERTYNRAYRVRDAGSPEHFAEPRQARLFEPNPHFNDARLLDTHDAIADFFRSDFEAMRDSGIRLQRDGEFIPLVERQGYVPHVFRGDAPGDLWSHYNPFRRESRAGPLDALRSRTATNIGRRLDPIPETMAHIKSNAALFARSAILGPARAGQVPIRFQPILGALHEVDLPRERLATQTLQDVAHGPTAGTSTTSQAMARSLKGMAGNAMLQASGPRQPSTITNAVSNWGLRNFARGYRSFVDDPMFREQVLASGSSDAALAGHGVSNNVPGSIIQGFERLNRTLGVAAAHERMGEIGRRQLRYGSVTAPMEDDARQLGYTPVDLAQRIDRTGRIRNTGDVQAIAERGAELAHFTVRAGTAAHGILTPSGSTAAQMWGFNFRQSGAAINQLGRPLVLAGREAARGELRRAAQLAGQAARRATVHGTLGPTLALSGGAAAALMRGQNPADMSTLDLLESADPMGGMLSKVARVVNAPAHDRWRVAGTTLLPASVRFLGQNLLDRGAMQGRWGDAAIGMGTGLDKTGTFGYVAKPYLREQDRAAREGRKLQRKFAPRPPSPPPPPSYP